jgi:hypothetical protein
MISDEDDSYTQQKALMSVADRFIELGRSDSALEVVDLAFQKAARVGEQHEAHDSTSPLIRKRKYLTEIRERYLKLKRFDKVSNLPGAFKTRDDLIKPFIAHTFIALAEAQSKTLSKKELGSLIAQAQKTFDGEDDKESYHYWVVSDVINAYAIIGNKAKAMDLLTKTLNDAESDDNYYLDDLLIFTGQAFEKNNLKATPELKKVLREIIGEPVSKS